MKNRESFFHLHLISDATGETLITVGRAAASQFAHTRAIEHVHALVRSDKYLERVIAELEAEPGIVLYTMVDNKLSEKLESSCRRLGIPCISVLEPLFQVMQSYLGAPGERRVGAQHVLDAEYFRRIDALNFTMMHDDGQLAGGLEDADVILVGISRTSKTPTSIYLANRGIRTANIPIVPGIPLPPDLEQVKHPLIVGLIASPERIIALRENRILSLNAARPNLAYVDRASVADEIAFTRKLCTRHNWPVIDVTRRSIEETAAAIMALHNEARESAEQILTILVLASGSAVRRTLLANAGLAFDVLPSTVDERAVEAPFLAAGATPAEIATALAEAKAVEVSRRRLGALVIGADQTLDCDGHRSTKSESLAEARAQLARLAGRDHQLHSAVAVARDGALLWGTRDTATLTMRPLTPAYIEAYLARVGADVLKSVGVYQLEGEGVRLFDRIEGSYFTILGLPLLPLLSYLRSAGAID